MYLTSGLCSGLAIGQHIAEGRRPCTGESPSAAQASMRMERSVLVSIFTHTHTRTRGGHFQKRTPIISLGRFIPGCWKGGCNWLLNLGFRRSNGDSVLVLEQQTNSLPLWICRKVKWVWPASLHVFCRLSTSLSPRGPCWGTKWVFGTRAIITSHPVLA